MFTIPPQHSPDDECVFISPNDPAWDTERLTQEKQLLIDSVHIPDMTAPGFEKHLKMSQEEAVRIVAEDRGKTAKEMSSQEKRSALKAAMLVELEEAQKKALAEHPTEIWYSGVSRFSLEAEHTLPECLRAPDGPDAVTISDYLESGATEFLIRPLSARARRRASKLIHGEGPGDWEFEVVREGLVGIRQPSGKHVRLEKTGPKGAKKIADSVLDMLDRVNLSLIGEIAQAIHVLTYRGGNAEGKP